MRSYHGKGAAAFESSDLTSIEDDFHHGQHRNCGHRWLRPTVKMKSTYTHVARYSSQRVCVSLRTINGPYRCEGTFLPGCFHAAGSGIECSEYSTQGPRTSGNTTRLLSKDVNNFYPSLGKPYCPGSYSVTRERPPAWRHLPKAYSSRLSWT